jgi:transposase
MADVARQLGVMPYSVQRWKEKHEEEGNNGLKAQPHPHRPSRMSQQQKAQLQEELLKGPEAFGYPNQLWTLERIAQVIEKKFGIRYHPCHVWKILTALGWSCQKPQRMAKEQNEALVAQWRQKDWSRIKQQAKRGKKYGRLH